MQELPPAEPMSPSPPIYQPQLSQPLPSVPPLPPRWQPPYQPPLPPPLPRKPYPALGFVIILILLVALLVATSALAYLAGRNSVASTLPIPISTQPPIATATPTFLTQTAPPTATPTAPAAGTWQDVMKWSDSVDQQTVLFTVPSEWRIAWGTTASLIVTLYASNGQVVAVPINTDHGSTGSYYAHAAPGTFYLNIQVISGSYTIDVQVLK